MERLTSNEVFGLMEAYASVYAPEQEVVEEDIEQLDEMGQPGARTTGQATAPISNAPYRSRFARPMNAGTPQQTGRATAVSRPQIGGLPSNYRGQELQAGARARASQVGTPRQGSAGTGAAPSAAAPRPVARPAAPVARPSVPATASKPAVVAKPAVTKTVPTTPATTTATATTPAPAPKKPSLAQQAAELRAMQAASQQRQGLTQSFDVFDVIKGHLLDEGYADTEEAAVKIMANMSEEWKEEIIESRVSELGDRLKNLQQRSDATDRRAEKTKKVARKRFERLSDAEEKYRKGAEEFAKSAKD